MPRICWSNGKYAPQAGHSKSPYSINVTFAFGLPSLQSAAEIGGTVVAVKSEVLVEFPEPLPDKPPRINKPITTTAMKPIINHRVVLFIEESMIDSILRFTTFGALV